MQYTRRSGLGVDAAGNLIYVAGGGMDLTTLAAALVQAGAVRSMPLDYLLPDQRDFFAVTLR